MNTENQKKDKALQKSQHREIFKQPWQGGAHPKIKVPGPPGWRFQARLVSHLYNTNAL